MTIRSVVRGVVRNVVRGVVRPIKRIFITADPILQTHYTMQNTVTFAGDFDVTFTTATSDATSFVALAGNPILTGHQIQYNDLGSARVRIAGVSYTFTALALRDGKLHTLGFRRIGTNLTMHQDGTDLETLTVATTAFTLEVVGQTLGAAFFDGVIANVTLTDLTTPSNSESWRLDQPFPITTEQSSSGSNLLTYVNADSVTRELFTLSPDKSQWDGELGTTLVIA